VREFATHFLNQPAGFNGQIKSKDDVTVPYQLVATGQTTPVPQKSLQRKGRLARPFNPLYYHK